LFIVKITLVAPSSERNGNQHFIIIIVIVVIGLFGDLAGSEGTAYHRGKRTRTDETAPVSRSGGLQKIR